MYKHWLNEKGFDWMYGLERTLWSVGTLTGDAREMVNYGEIVNDESRTISERESALDSFESYSAIGSIVQDSWGYLEYVAKYARDAKITEHEVVDMAEELLRSHRPGRK